GLHRIGFHIDIALECYAGRMAEKSVAGAREAIGAAMLAAAIGVDRALETDIGAVIAGDDAAGPLDMLDGFEHRQRLHMVPAIVEILAPVPLEASALVGLGAAPANAVRAEQFAPRQIGVPAPAETLKRFKGRHLHDGHSIISGRVGWAESPCQRPPGYLASRWEHNKNNSRENCEWTRGPESSREAGPDFRRADGRREMRLLTSFVTTICCDASQ